MFEKIKVYLISKWPDIRSWLYRWVRGAFSTAIAETLYMTCQQFVETFDVLTCAVSIRDKWSDPKEALILISIAFASGFILALGKALRDGFGTNKNGTPNTFNKVSPL